MNMPFAGIVSLPLELLDEIIACVAVSAPGLLILRCVNKTLCRLITPTAFREIAVHTTEKSTQHFLELLVSTDISKHVRVIEIIGNSDLSPHEDPHENRPGETHSLRFKRVRDRLREAFSMLHRIPSLESLVITFFTDEDAWNNPLTYMSELSRPQPLQLAVLEGLASNPNPLPALQSLHIHAWLAIRDDLYSEAPFKRIVESLRDLRFNVEDAEDDSDDDISRLEPTCEAHYFWSYVIGPRVLRPAVNLTSLAMESSIEFGSLIRLNLRSITYPCLTSLSLSSFIWDDSILDPSDVTLHAEDFIVRHGKTLKKLELHSCKIAIPDDRSTPVRSWTAVWNRFSEELTELVDLDVDYHFDRRYAQFKYGYNMSVAVPGTEQDIPALEALATIVKKRKGLTYCASDKASSG